MRYQIYRVEKVKYIYVIDADSRVVIATFDFYDDAELFCLAKNGLLGG